MVLRYDELKKRLEEGRFASVYFFSGDEAKPVPIEGHHEWPLGVFVGWYGSRPLQFVPIEGLRQRIESLNHVPKVTNLHEHQREQRLRR